MTINDASQTRFNRNHTRRDHNTMLRVLLTVLTVLIVSNIFTPTLSAAITRNGIPILPDLPNCGRYTISKPCGDNCQQICGLHKPRYCMPGCIVNGCVCIPGYIRRDENGPCIPEAWCKLVAEEVTVEEKLHFRIYDN